MRDPSVHAVADRGFARAADIYAASRPGYPRETLDWLRDALAIGPGSHVVEIGAGTGSFTRLLRETGATITAVDAVAPMLASLGAALPDVATIVAPAQDVPLADGSADAIVCATAFHWFANATTLAEFRRLLRPGGSLGLIWNVRDERVPWVARLSAITNAHARDEPRQQSQDWRAAFPAPGFSPLVETVLRYDHVGSTDDVVVGRTLSTSFIAALDPADRATVAAEVRAFVAATPELADGASVAFPYVTRAYRCHRID